MTSQIERLRPFSCYRGSETDELPFGSLYTGFGSCLSAYAYFFEGAEGD